MSAYFRRSRADQYQDKQLGKYLNQFDFPQCKECDEPLDEDGICPKCTKVSDCCGAEIIEDTDICSDCNEHC